MFVRKDSPVKSRKISSAAYLAPIKDRTLFTVTCCATNMGVDDSKLNWVRIVRSFCWPALKEGKVDAAVLLDQFFFRGEEDNEIRCLYTDGEVWQALHGFPEMIKHMVAVREDLLRDNPGIKDALLKGFRASFAWSEQHLPEIADVFVKYIPAIARRCWRRRATRASSSP